MKMFSDCSGPCEDCEIGMSGGPCLAGHGDDDFVPASEKSLRKALSEERIKTRDLSRIVEEQSAVLIRQTRLFRQGQEVVRRMLENSQVCPICLTVRHTKTCYVGAYLDQ